MVMNHKVIFKWKELGNLRRLMVDSYYLFLILL